MCDGTSQEGFTRSRRTVQEDTFRLSDTECIEEFRVFNGEFNDFFDLFDLLFESSNHLVSRVGNFLDHHHLDERVLFRWQDRVELVRVGAEGDSEVRSELRELDRRGKVDN